MPDNLTFSFPSRKYKLHHAYFALTTVTIRYKTRSHTIARIADRTASQQTM